MFNPLITQDTRRQSQTNLVFLNWWQFTKKSKKKFKEEIKSSDEDLIFLGQDSMGIKNDLLKSEKKNTLKKLKKIHL